MRSQQVLYLTLAQAYLTAVREGKDYVMLQLDWLSDTLSFLDSKDNTPKPFVPAPDDMSQAEQLTLFKTPLTNAAQYREEQKNLFTEEDHGGTALA